MSGKIIKYADFEGFISPKGDKLSLDVNIIYLIYSHAKK